MDNSHHSEKHERSPSPPKDVHYLENEGPKKDGNVILGGENLKLKKGVKNSIISGDNVKCNHNHSFVYNSSSLHTTSAAGQYTVKNTGGIRFFSNSSETTGTRLAPGSSSWSVVSDASAKENLVECDYADKMDGVESIPVYTYNYIGNQPEQKCVGPLAQDWNSTFPIEDMELLDPETGLPVIDPETELPIMVPAKDPCLIETMDMIGVLLCCTKNLKGSVDTISSNISDIQSDVAGLVSADATFTSQIASLQGDVSSLESDVSSLDSRVTSLEGDVSTLQGLVTTIQGQIAIINGILNP